MSEDQRPMTRNRVETRAGVTGHHAKTVLLLSTLAVIVCFVAVYAYYFAR